MKKHVARIVHNRTHGEYVLIAGLVLIVLRILDYLLGPGVVPHFFMPLGIIVACVGCTLWLRKW